MKLSVELYSTDAEEWWNTAPSRALRPDAPLPKLKAGSATTTTTSSTKEKASGAKKVSLVNIANDAKEMKLLEAGYKEIMKPDISHVTTSTRLEGVDGARLYRNDGITPPCPDGIGPILVEDGEHRNRCFFLLLIKRPFDFLIAEIWMEEHLAKWDIVKEKKNLECSLCSQPVDTSVSMITHLRNGSVQF